MRTKKPRIVKSAVKRPRPAENGFTLIELLVVIGIIGILASVVLVAVNPAKQFAQARNSQRQAAVAAILDAVDQNMVDHNGTFDCPSYTLTSDSQHISNGLANIQDCLVPDYLPSLPLDPSVGSDAGNGVYKTGYYISQDSSGRITIEAPSAELNQTISITR